MDDQFLKFYENIKLTSSQREDAKTKYAGVCKKLHDYYYSSIEYNGSTKLLIGSYAKHTHIRPARDIDVIFIMPAEKFDQYNDNQSNCQAQLLQDIKKILVEKYPNTPIRADEKVVALEFADTKHDVELLPAWENPNGTFKIPNSKNDGSWENWGPRAEIKMVNDSDQSTGKTRLLIRMVKKWSENCTAQIKSYKIENTVVNFFITNSDPKEDGYSLLVRNFFAYFHSLTIDENLKSHLLTAFNRAKKACDLEKDEKNKEATEEWQKIFGGDFPSIIENKAVNLTTEEIIKSLYLKYPSDEEEYLETKYGIKTDLNNSYLLKIDAEIEQNGFRNNFLSNFILRNFPLLKNKWLTFKIIRNTTPSPFEIKWKVRNFGDEAKVSHDLRGEISDDARACQKKERTRYAGEHYVECYIIKDGICVAKDKVLVPVGIN